MSTATTHQAGAIAWTGLAKLFHWLMAVLIIAMLGLGLYMAALPFSDFKIELYQIHKSLGLTILALLPLRLLWRVVNPTPPLPATITGWQRIGANFSHVLLYGLMIGVPLTGWIMASAFSNQLQTTYFGLFDVPNLIAPSAEWRELMVWVHASMNIALMGVLALHIGAAVKHHWVDKDDVLKRMLP